MEVPDPLEVLIVEDDPGAVAVLVDLLTESGFRAAGVEFEEARYRIRRGRPDIVVIDLVDSAKEASGNQVVDFVWAEYFCPIVIFSGHLARADFAAAGHPLVQQLEKRPGADAEVVKAVGAMKPYAEVLRRGHDENGTRFGEALRVASATILAPTSGLEEVGRVVRAARRRFAAAVDLARGGEGSMEAWEQYVCPPLSPHPLTGDIIRRRAGDRTDPKEFAVILSPSCDLVAVPGRTPKSGGILTAKCARFTSELTPTLGKPRAERRRKEIARGLNQGYFDDVLPLPALEGRIPAMAARLRDLRVVAHSEVGRGDGTEEYEIVASVDSPFRELVAWAYMRLAARPGLPDRNTESWAREIDDAVRAAGGGS